MRTTKTKSPGVFVVKKDTNIQKTTTKSTYKNKNRTKKEKKERREHKHKLSV